MRATINQEDFPHKLIISKDCVVLEILTRKQPKDKKLYVVTAHSYELILQLIRHSDSFPFHSHFSPI